MRYALTLPPFADFADPRVLIDATRRAEAAGWDAFFVWDHVFFSPDFYPNLDPWVGLAGVAASTTRIRIGTLITPMSRRRPWKLARETVTLDQLSNGRLILGVGIGDPAQWDFGFFHEPTDAKVRAQMLDEGLQVLTGLWSGQRFHFDGQHYHIEEMIFQPTPVQQPRIPIWVGGTWGRQAPLRRAARWDGYVPIKPGGLLPEDCRQVLETIKPYRTADTPFDLIGGSALPADHKQARERLHEYADSGLTWWLDAIDPWTMGKSWEQPWETNDTRKMLDRIDQGPIKL